MNITLEQQVQLVEAHWNYIEKVLKFAEVNCSEIGVYYRAGFLFGAMFYQDGNYPENILNILKPFIFTNINNDEFKFHFTSAFEHGWKHAAQDSKDNM